MSTDKLISASYIFDMVVKGFIAIVVTLGGYHVKEVTENIKNLTNENNSEQIRLSIIENTMPQISKDSEARFSYLSKQLERLEAKLDKALDKR